MFEYRVLTTSKDLGHPEEYEDAWHIDAAAGRAAVADGVSSAIFSGRWARILTKHVVADPPDMEDVDSLVDWLEHCRSLWLKEINPAKLPWNQRSKLQQVGGAFSTLLWIEVQPLDNDADSESAVKRYHVTCTAIGDCNLFSYRNGEYRDSFPMESSAQFDEDPLSICSVNLGRDNTLQFQMWETECDAGDEFVLCSDAIGKMAWDRIENDSPLDFRPAWQQTEDDWLAEIEANRSARRMRRDDTTLMLLRIGTGCGPIEIEESAGPTAEAPPFDDAVSATADVAVDESTPSGIPVETAMEAEIDEPVSSDAAGTIPAPTGDTAEGDPAASEAEPTADFGAGIELETPAVEADVVLTDDEIAPEESPQTTDAEVTESADTPFVEAIAVDDDFGQNILDANPSADDESGNVESVDVEPGADEPADITTEDAAVIRKGDDDH